jgi:hypothetical protein
MVRRWRLIGHFPILYYPQLEVPLSLSDSSIRLCRCLDHWGGWEDALGLFEAIEVAMRVTESAPNEKVSLLQKIAAVSVPLNKTDDGASPPPPRINEKVSLLQKIAAVSVPLNKTDDGASPPPPRIGHRL